MTPETVGVLAIVALVVLLFCNMWISLAMALAGFLGFVYLAGIDRALAVLGTVPYSSTAFYSVTVIPLFVLMGAVVSSTGLGGDLYDTAYKWFGQLRGGLAIATVVACAAFAAVCGSSVASAVTMGRVTLPEMKRYKYDDALATGCVASGGTLGILIPPSLGFILYGILTEESIGKLFMAGILPGILLSLLFIVTVIIWCARNRKAGPAGRGTRLKDKITSLKNTWAIVALFLLVIGGIYFGIFTPTEAGAIGAFGAIIITLIARRLTVKNLLQSILDTGQTTAMILLLIIGAFIFMRFLTISELPSRLAGTVGGLALPAYIILLIIVLFYFVVGMFLEVNSCMVLTIPFVFPVITALGFDPIWFGVIVVILIEMGLVTPPVGMNVFVLAGVTDVPLGTIFKGVWPFVGAMLFCILILTIFPAIATFIPSMM